MSSWVRLALRVREPTLGITGSLHGPTKNTLTLLLIYKLVFLLLPWTLLGGNTLWTGNSKEYRYERIWEDGVNLESRICQACVWGGISGNWNAHIYSEDPRKQNCLGGTRTDRAGWTWDGLLNMCPAMRYQSWEGLACSSLDPHPAMKLERGQ